jgi:hypothetical protein
MFVQFWVTGVTTFFPSAPPNSFGLLGLSPVELLVTNSEGQQVGNVGPGTVSGSRYSRDYPIGDDNGTGGALGDPSGLKSAFISGAASDTYSVSATGTGSGSFTLYLESTDDAGNVHTLPTTGVTAPGAKATYQLIYSSTPGARVELNRGCHWSYRKFLDVINHLSIPGPRNEQRHRVRHT